MCESKKHRTQPASLNPFFKKHQGKTHQKLIFCIITNSKNHPLKITLTIWPFISVAPFALSAKAPNRCRDQPRQGKIWWYNPIIQIHLCTLVGRYHLLALEFSIHFWFGFLKLVWHKKSQFFHLVHQLQAARQHCCRRWVRRLAHLGRLGRLGRWAQAAWGVEQADQADQPSTLWCLDT